MFSLHLSKKKICLTNKLINFNNHKKLQFNEKTITHHVLHVLLLCHGRVGVRAPHRGHVHTLMLPVKGTHALGVVGQNGSVFHSCGLQKENEDNILNRSLSNNNKRDPIIIY